MGNVSSITHAPPRARRERTHEAAAATAPRRRSERQAESWTRSQQNLALALHVTGKKTLDEIAERLSLRPDTVTRMIVAGKRA